MLVLTGGLQEQLLGVPRFQYLLEFCKNNSEHFQNNRTYWSSAGTTLMGMIWPADWAQDRSPEVWLVLSFSCTQHRSLFLLLRFLQTGTQSL